MKTIFVTCFTGLISRNILATDAFALLTANPGTRIVIIAPEARAPALTGEYGAANVTVVGVPTPPLAGWDRALWILATNLLRTRTRRVQRRAKFERDRSWLDYLGSAALGLLGMLRPVRSLFRVAAKRLGSVAEFTRLFDEYRPDLLFATDVFTVWDAKMMRLASRRGVKTVGMVRSWDNVTSKTLLAFIPEHMVAGSMRVKAELIRYGDVPAGRIAVVGIPHYDRYTAAGRTPRAEFFRKIGLDPKRKTILFTPPSDRYLQQDPITPMVLRALEGVDAQVLVRTSLVGTVDLGGYAPPKSVAFDQPSNSPDFAEAHLSREADRHLADSIYHADVIVTWASTMIIDAAVFGKPIVLVGFDAEKRPYAKSIQQYYDYDHQRRIIDLGGARLARSPGELGEAANAYLKDPNRDAAGRKRITDEYCGALDGKAGERLGRYLIEKMRNEK